MTRAAPTRPLTAEGVRAGLRTDAGLDVSISTARVYLTELREEGRVRSRTIRGPANRAGVALFWHDDTPADVVAEAIEAIESKPMAFEGYGMAIGRRRAGAGA